MCFICGTWAITHVKIVALTGVLRHAACVVMILQYGLAACVRGVNDLFTANPKRTPVAPGACEVLSALLSVSRTLVDSCLTL